MAERRKRIGPLDNAGSIASENRKVYAELRRSRIEPSLASRLSQMLMNQKVIIEAHDFRTQDRRTRGLTRETRPMEG